MPSLTKPARQPPAEIPNTFTRHPPTLTALRGPLTSSCRLGMVPPSHPISLRFRVLSPTGDKLPVEDFRLRTSGLPRKRHSGRSPISIRGRGSQRAGGRPQSVAPRPAGGALGPPPCPKPLSFIELCIRSLVYLFMGRNRGRTHILGDSRPHQTCPLQPKLRFYTGI